MVASACEPAPASLPPTLAPTTVASAAPSELVEPTRPPASPLADIPFANALRDALDVDGITTDLRRLQDITDRHGGTRPAGSDGFRAAADLVGEQLRSIGFDVRLQDVELPVFTQTGPSELEITGTGARAFEDIHDFKAMLFSPSAELTAPLYALGYDPDAAPGDSGGLGCSPGDWLNVPAGVVVLMQPGSCRRHDAVVQAQIAGAVGVITAYPAWGRDGVLRPTLLDPSDIRIPVLGTSGSVGNALNDAAVADASVHISVRTSTVTGTSVNVIGESPWGDPGHVLMLGGHLDSVVDGPGMNDNGSGTMTVLGIARALAATARNGSGTATPPPATWRVRVAFWTGEEIGLWGSRAYVSSLPPGTVDAYLNFDMLGSPNGVRDVYDGASSSRPTEGVRISGLFSRALDEAGLLWQAVPLGGSSDHFSFDQAGIPTGGLFSGANELKSRDEATLFGGTAGAAEDPCYHLACDTLDRIDAKLLGELARAAAWTAGALASGEVGLSGE
jgi:aminopeptidase Y